MKKLSIIAVAAAFICMLVYLRALSCGFINIDDPHYVQNNLFIRQIDWKLFSWAFSSTSVGFWLPLTWLSFAIDYQIWGGNPAGYHLTNILLHSANSAIVVLITNRIYLDSQINKIVLPESKYLYSGMLLLAGLLFGLHPLRVESVAWITARKDVLNGIFSLSSTLFYLRFVQKRKNSQNGARGDYFVSLALFVFSLLAKSVSIVIPLMLLVIDWYPLRRFQKGRFISIFVEKLPYFAIAAVVSITTIIIGSNENLLVSFTDLPFSLRFVVSGNAVFEYCRLFLFPVGILPYYELAKSIPPLFAVKTAVVVIISFFFVYSYRKFNWLVSVWLLFIIPLLPVLAFAQNGYAAMASRFTYLPAVSVSIFAAIGIASLCQKLLDQNKRYCLKIAIFLTIFLLAFYVGTSLRLINVWKNSDSLWSRVIEFKPTSSAYRYRGLFYFETGNYQAAIDDLTKSIEFPEGPELIKMNNLYAWRGKASLEVKRYQDAIDDLTDAILIFPAESYYYNRAVALQAMGRGKEAEQDFILAGSATVTLEWYE